MTESLLLYQTADWKDSAAYPSQEEAHEYSMDRWAELFLWRNTEFVREIQGAYEQQTASKEEGQLPPCWNQTPVGTVLTKWGVERIRLPEWVKAGVGDSLNVFEKHPLLAHSAVIGETRISWMPRNPARMVLEFDLTAPIPPQIRRAKRWLETNAKWHANGSLPKEVRRVVRMYPLYLRVLDALATGASRTEIADHLSLENPAGVTLTDVNNWINAAQELALEGYKRIAKLADV